MERREQSKMGACAMAERADNAAAPDLVAQARAWLHRVAVNVVIGDGRSRSRRLKRESTLGNVEDLQRSAPTGIPGLGTDLARDLLPGIRQAAKPNPARFHRWGALAASLLLVASAAIGALLIQQRTGPTVAQSPAAESYPRKRWRLWKTTSR